MNRKPSSLKVEVPGTGSPKKLVVIIGTSNIRKSNCLADQGSKKRPLLYLTIVAWTSNYFCNFCNASDVSSSKNEVAMYKVSISINLRRWRSQTVWPTKIKRL